MPLGHSCPRLRARAIEKTISQPFIVAVMTDLLELRPDDIVLEIGHRPRVPSRRARRIGRHGVQRRHKRIVRRCTEACLDDIAIEHRLSRFALACGQPRRWPVREASARARPAAVHFQVNWFFLKSPPARDGPSSASNHRIPPASPAGFALPHAIDRPPKNINFAQESSYWSSARRQAPGLTPTMRVKTRVR
jgi:Protein-L-isoaspartate(D-aspartate) O-methyltransferase (PCMT)